MLRGESSAEKEDVDNSINDIELSKDDSWKSEELVVCLCKELIFLKIRVLNAF